MARSAIADLPYLRRAGGARRIGYPRGIAAIAHLGVEPIALFLERGHQRPVERAAARQLDAHRIDEAGVDQDFVMDVRSGGHAGRADEADDLALPYPLCGV